MTVFVGFIRLSGVVVRAAKVNEKWAENFDKDIGPFEAKYGDMTSDLSKIYDNAKEEHARGLQVMLFLVPSWRPALPAFKHGVWDKGAGEERRASI